MAAEPFDMKCPYCPKVLMRTFSVRGDGKVELQCLSCGQILDRQFVKGFWEGFNMKQKPQYKEDNHGKKGRQTE